MLRPCSTNADWMRTTLNDDNYILHSTNPRSRTQTTITAIWPLSFRRGGRVPSRPSSGSQPQSFRAAICHRPAIDQQAIPNKNITQNTVARLSGHIFCPLKRRHAMTRSPLSRLPSPRTLPVSSLTPSPDFPIHSSAAQRNDHSSLPRTSCVAKKAKGVEENKEE